MDDRSLAFHGLAIKRHADAEAVASLTGLAPEVAKASLEAGVAGGRVAAIRGAYTLAPLARVAIQARYDLHFDALRQDAGFRAADDRFEQVNPELKQIITEWQTRDVRGERHANDHADQAYDDKVIDRLSALHERFEPGMAALARGLPRLAIYGRKLEAALDLAEGGDGAWVSDIHRDSYHTVWFELHEDLLRIMGRERVE